MYIPKHFSVKDKNEALAFVERNSFGTLISSVEKKLFSSHLPFLITPDQTHLLCHVARENPQWREISNQEVLVTFLGEHAYVSPTWYNSPGVPTWNYQAVHVYGTARAVEDKSAIKSIILGLTKIHESGESPWNPEFKDAQLNAIVAIQIEITDIQCKYKLSQNRPEEDQIAVSGKLDMQGHKTLCKAMKNVVKQKI